MLGRRGRGWQLAADRHDVAEDGMHLARRVGIPSENQAMTVPHSASAAERLWEARRPGRRPELGRRTVRRSSTRPVAGASSSAESCCRPPRSRSSGPSRVIRSSATGDNGVSVDTQSAKRRSRQKSFLCWLRRRHVDFDPPYGEATSDEVAGGGRRELPGEGVDRDREGAGREQRARIDWRTEVARDLAAPAMAIGSNPLRSTIQS